MFNSLILLCSWRMVQWLALVVILHTMYLMCFWCPSFCSWELS